MARLDGTCSNNAGEAQRSQLPRILKWRSVTTAPTHGTGMRIELKFPLPDLRVSSQPSTHLFTRGVGLATRPRIHGCGAFCTVDRNRPSRSF